MKNPVDCPAADWTGILLAGGKSLRMGTDKRHMSVSCLPSRSLMEHASRLLASLCRERLVLVATASETDLPVGFTPIPDAYPGAGPLPALSDCLQQISTPYALVIPVDMPCLPKEQMLQWMQTFSSPASTSAARFVLDANQRPTFPLVVKQEFADGLAAEVASGQVRLFQGLRAAGADGVEPAWQLPDRCGPDPFLNINHPADLETLESGFKSTTHES